MWASRTPARAKGAWRNTILAGLFGLLAGVLPATAALAALDVSISIAPTYANPIFPGDVTAFRITLTNSNTAADVTGASFVDNMPVGLKVAGVGVRAYTCADGDGNTSAGAGTVGAVVGASTISLSGGVIPKAKSGGAAGRCDIDVEVTSTVRNSAQLNTIPVGAVTGNDGAAVSNGTQAQQSVTVNNLNLPVITKNFSSSVVVRNDQPATLTMVISNANNPGVNLPLNGGGDSPAYALRDSLPAGLEVAQTPNASAVCSGSGSAPSFSPAAGATTLTAVGGTVAAGGSCTLKVDVVGTTSSGTSNNGVFSQSLTNTIDRSADFANVRGLVPASNATAALSVRSALGLSKSFNPGTVAAGQQASLVITLSNASPISTLHLDAAEALREDQIDGDASAGFGLLITGTPTTTCGGSVTKSGSSEGFTLAGGSIAPNASCTVTLPYTGTLQNAGAPQSFTNTIPALAVKTDENVASPSVTASVNVIDQLTVSKASTPATVAPGNPVRYTITVNNYTASALTNVKVTDALPSGMLLLATNPAAPALSGSPCTGLSQDGAGTAATPVFVIATFAGNAGATPATCTITFWAQSPQGAGAGVVLSNQIAAGAVTGTGPGGPVVNASGSGAVTATVGNAITVNKGFSPGTAFEGTVSQLTITFTNITAQPITAATFTDNLPLGSTGLQLVVANPANASTTCAGGAVTAAPGASAVTLAGATLPARASNGTGANGTCTLTVSVVGAAGSYVNTLPASALSGTETYADATTHTTTSPGPVSASLTYNSALTAAKSFSPTTITSGGMSTVSILLGNIGSGTLNGVGVVDPLPTGMTIASPANAQTTCGGSPAITAAAGASSATLAGAVIPAGGQCNFLFNVTAAGAGNWVNTIPVGNVSADGGVRNVSIVTSTLTNSAAGGVSVTNNTSPNSLTSPGQVSLLTITITNGGSIALSGLSLTDYFTANGLAGGSPTGMIIAGAPNAATTCAGGLASATAGGTRVSLSGAALAAGASCTISVNVTLNTTGTVQNTIPVGAIVDSQGISNTLATTTSLSAGSNLGVTKAFLPAVIKPGERSRLRITLINPLAVAVSNLAVTDNLPAGVVVPTGANPTTTCVGGVVSAPTTTQVTMTGGSLPAASGGVSAICIAEIDVTAAAAGAYSNVIATGQVTGMVGGGPATNPVPAQAPLEVRSPVTIAKAFSPNAVGLGAPTTATITLTNPNGVALTSASLQDLLPANLTVALTPNASTTCAGGVVTATASATSVLLTGGTIPANGSCTIKFDALSNIAGVYVNTIPAGALATATGVTNENPASDTVRIINPPTVSKQFVPAVIPAGGTSTLTIVLGNSNATPATLTSSFVDTLPTSPAPIVVATPNGLGGTCPGGVTATAGSGTVTYANGATIPVGGCTIIVGVTGSAEGVYTNNIGVGALKTNQGDNLQPANADLTISPLGFISGRAFKDNNVTPNGTFELGTDAPIAGVTVTLTGTDYGPNGVAGGGDDAPVSRSLLTDALGNYAFTALNPGAYTVTEPSQPAGTQNGITTAGPVSGGGGGTAGSATAVGVTPSAIAGVILLKDGTGRVANSTGDNFAEIAPSSIAGSVFLDQDDNGARNAADTAISGATVQLLSGASVVATTTTDASGGYLFSNLAPGTYTVREPAQPAGTANGKTLPGVVGNGGAVGTATAQNVVPSQITGIVLPPNTASTGNDFAEVPAGRQVSGRVFIDANNDGVFNGGDSGLQSVVLNLTGTDFNGLPVNASTTTTSDGRYVFTGLAAGAYTVTEPNQPGGTQSGITTAGSTGGLATIVTVTPSVISTINLTGTNTISSGNDFGEVAAPDDGGGGPTPTASVTGKIYVDANDDGVPDASETGIGGVTVTLVGVGTGGASLSFSTTSRADGTFSFGPIPAGTYSLTEIQPSTVSDGKTTITGAPGASASTKPVGAGGQDVITGVTVTTTALSGYNFGERSTGSIAGQVYVDANDNGVREAGEGSIAGVVLRLTGTDGAGAAVDRTTTSGADGGYVFANLQASNAGGYTMTEAQPTAFRDGRTTIPAGQPGSAAAAKPVASGGADTISAIVLASGRQLGGYDFGELGSSASVAGYVFVDGDNDGVRDPGEAAIPDVTVRLSGVDATGATVNLTRVTGADGAFLFDNTPVSGGSGYVLTEVQPAGFNDGKTAVPAGAPGQPSSGKPVGVGDQDRIGGVVVTQGQALTDYRFGEVAIPQLKTPIINGYVFLDRAHTRVRPTDGSLEGQGGWTVVLRQGGQVICTTATDAKGFYQFDNLHCPGYEASGLPTGSGFSIGFSRDGNNMPNVPVSGGDRGTVPPTGGQILNITLSPTDRVVEQNLPLDPAGVVYDSVTRKPVAGAGVVISGPAGFDPTTHLVGGVAAMNQTVGADGLYQFLLQNNFPSGVYTLTVTAPAGYLPAPSASLPPCANTLSVSLAVNPGQIQRSDFAPGQSVTPQLDPNACPGLVPGGSTTTQYFLRFLITNGGSAPILNNHIPLDPVLSGTLVVTKTTPMVWASRGGLVPYTITATNPQAAPLPDVSVRDQLPPGFKYREGSATRNGQPVQITVANGFVSWPAETFAAKEKKTYGLLLVVGSGVGEGDYVNRAWGARQTGGAQVSNTASASVRIAPDPTLDCPDVIGKVFDDRNANGYQDDGEPGVPAVRLAAPNGLLITTDADGRYHVPCPAIPNADRGSNFVLKLDTRSLPSGFRVTTENPRDVRLTRGKLVKLNFGATVHRVVRVELSDTAFAQGSTDLQQGWRTQLDGLPDQLKARPSIVRLAYSPGGDPPDLVRRRLAEIRKLIAHGWKSAKGRYALVVEVEGEQE